MEYPVKLARRGIRTFLDLARIMLPVMILVRVGEEFGLSQSLGHILGPVMDFVGLPAETGLVWAVTLLLGIYAGVGAYLGLLSNLDLTLAQHSILCSMMLFAHSIPVEQAIVRRAGASFIATSLLRIGSAFAYGAFVAWICGLTNSLAEPLEPTWLTRGLITDLGGDDWISWAIATAMTLMTIFGIIIFLLILLDGLEKLGFVDWITRVLSPTLRAIGMDSRLAPLATIGLVLGLTYGGGLIIQSVRNHKVSKRSLFLALAFLSICHGLIEDTGMMLAIGADIWVVLVGKLVFTVVLMLILAAGTAAIDKRWPGAARNTG